jgi:hypothetical protein
MADALVSRHIPALYNGVSQQNPTLRQPSQAEAQVNMYGTVQDGLRKRPPSQHLAQVTTADWSTAHVHTINRDTSERYLVVVTDGDLKVFDADTGAEKTVAFPTGKGYLSIVGGGNAEDSFALDSIADYSFITNKTVVCATKTSPTTTPTFYNNWYQPDTWGPRRADRYYNPNGAGALTGTVNTWSDLPHPEDAAPPSNGDLYKVVGYDEDNFGGYYVRRSGGVWVETYGPGANLSYDEDTLPHALVRESDGTFTFTPFSYTARQFGDANTNPPATFDGRTINGVFYWKNRLGFITDENVVLSTAGDYGNFWRNTMTTLLDSDIVDVALATNKVSILKFAIPFNDTMMLFADQSQFSLSVRDVLTPVSVSIDEATGFEMDDTVAPVRVGSEVYFVSKAGSWSRIREYFVNDQTMATDAADITAHVPRYVPNQIISLAGSDVEDALFCVSQATGYKNRIYVYKVFWSGDQKAQSAWSYWELDASDVLLSVDVIEDEVFALIKRSDATYLEKFDLDVNAETLALGWDILLDRRYEVQPGDMSYSVGLNETTITLPYDLSANVQGNWKVILTAGTGDVGKLVDQSDYTFEVVAGNNEISVPGDITGGAPVVGVNYEGYYQLSEQFVYTSSDEADTTGRLNLRTLTVNYKDSGFFQVEVYPYGTDFTADVEDVVPAALDAFTGRTLGEAQLVLGEAEFDTGVYQTYIDGNSRDVVIALKNPSHLQSKFTSAEWEGKFTKRTRSI